MNDNLKNVYHRILFDKDAPGEEPDQAARELLQEEFARKRKRITWILWAFLAFEFWQMAIFLTIYTQVSNAKLELALAVLFIISWEVTVLIKLWYWVVHTRLLLVREVKELRLEVAELAAREKTPGP